jgi:plastocyanin domain-containing protein
MSDLLGRGVDVSVRDGRAGGRHDHLVDRVLVDRVPVAGPAQNAAPITAGAVRVRVSSSGFEPARIPAEPGKSLTIAFERLDAQNCGGRVVFAELGINRELPLGITIVALPSVDGEVRFTCGMVMYRGSVVLKTQPF